MVDERPIGRQKLSDVSTPSIANPKIHQYEERDTTPYVRKLRQRLSSKIKGNRDKLVMPEEEAKGGRGVVMVKCEKERHPDIDFRIIPTELVDISVDWNYVKPWKTALTGKIKAEIYNRSDEGEVGTTKIPLREYLVKGKPEDDSEYDWQTKYGSADFKDDSNWGHDFEVEEENEKLGDVNDGLRDELRDGNAVEKIEGEWRVTGLELVESIWDILTTGQVTLGSNFSVTVYYTFRGEDFSESRSIDNSVTVPVE